MLVRTNSSICINPIPGIPLPDIEEEENTISSSNNSANIALPTKCSFFNFLHSKDTYQIITADELVILLSKKTFMDHIYDEVIILDARFDYEFEGGRITGAQNVCTRDDIPIIYNSLKGGNMCIVFHCEFSQNRGPTLMKLFRKHDRQQNLKGYPRLKFPNLFLLKGGYKQFYSDHSEFCIGGYTPMRDKKYILNGQLKRCYSDYTKNMLLSFEEVNNHFSPYKSPTLSISPSQFKACSQSPSLDAFSIRGKRSISLPAIHNSCSQALTFPDDPDLEPTICRSSSKALTPVSVPPHFTFSQQSSLSQSPTPFYATQDSINSFDSENPDELKSPGFESLSEILFPSMP